MAFRQRHYLPIVKPGIEFSATTGQAESSFKQPAPYYRSAPKSKFVPLPEKMLQQDTESPHYILEKYPHKLIEPEREEILNYPKIYYFGENAQKTYNTKKHEFYDDSEGDARPVLRDHVAYRYELLQLLGSGSFGKVFRALDHCTNTLVALKMLKSRKRFRKEGVVELEILNALKRNAGGSATSHNTHCMMILDSGDFRQHQFFTMEIMKCDLYALLCKNNLKGFPVNFIKKVAFETLTALRYSFSLSIINADIKPENLLIQDQSVTVIDWGSGCFVGKTIYSYIQSRYYRAPEVILGLPYSIGIDVWSLGCVFCELFTGEPIFPGEDEYDQLGKIAEYLGLPPNEMIKNSERAVEFFWNPGKGKIMLKTNHKVGKRSFLETFGAAGANFVELIEKMIRWDENQRMMPEQLLQLAFFEGFIDD